MIRDVVRGLSADSPPKTPPGVQVLLLVRARVAREEYALAAIAGLYDSTHRPLAMWPCVVMVLSFRVIALLGCTLIGGVVMAETIHFDADTAGALPSGWIAGVTGRGSHRWTIEADASAPSKPNVLKQSARGDFPWCVVRDARLADGFVEVKFKPLSGKEDQAGGLVWRWKDGDTYYVARANALENNVSLYHTEGGSRKTITYVSTDSPISPNEWHTLRIDFLGKHIVVTFDAKKYIEL